MYPRSGLSVSEYDVYHYVTSLNYRSELLYVEFLCNFNNKLNVNEFIYWYVVGPTCDFSL